MRLKRRAISGIKDALAAIQQTIRIDRLATIAVRVTGGMGDQIVAARFLRDLQQYIGSTKIDVYTVSEGMDWLYASLPNVSVIKTPTRVFHWLAARYRLALQITHTVDIVHVARDAESQWPRLSHLLAHIAPYRKMLARAIDAHPRLDFHPALIAYFQQVERSTFLNHVTGVPFGGTAFPLAQDVTPLRENGLLEQPYITVHNSFNEAVGQRRANRDYPFLNDVVAEVKQHLPGIAVVQVGVVDGKLSSADVNFSRQTTQPQIASIIANSAMHFDIECGLVHLASCVGTPCCVVFGPTPISYYAYPDNLNISPRECGGCWSVVKDWDTNCLRTGTEPPCMFTQPPEAVAQAALPRLRDVLMKRARRSAS